MEPAGAGFEEARRDMIPPETYDQENPAKWAENDDWKLDLPFYGFEKSFSARVMVIKWAGSTFIG